VGIYSSYLQIIDKARFKTGFEKPSHLTHGRRLAAPTL